MRSTLGIRIGYPEQGRAPPLVVVLPWSTRQGAHPTSRLLAQPAETGPPASAQRSAEAADNTSSSGGGLADFLAAAIGFSTVLLPTARSRKGLRLGDLQHARLREDADAARRPLPCVPTKPGPRRCGPPFPHGWRLRAGARFAMDAMVDLATNGAIGMATYQPPGCSRRAWSLSDMSGRDDWKLAAPQLRHSRPRSRAVMSPSAAVLAKPRTLSFAGDSGQTHSSDAGFESR